MESNQPIEDAEYDAESSPDLDTLSMGFSLDEEAQARVQQKWQRLRAYGFVVGEHNILAPQGQYCELLTRFKVSPLPNSPDHFLGLTNVRGNLVPIYQLEPLLELPKIKPTYALVMGNLSSAGAVLVKDKPTQFDLSSFSRDQDPDPLPKLLQNVLTESYWDGTAHWHAINHTKLFKQLSSTFEANNIDSKNTDTNIHEFGKS